MTQTDHKQRVRALIDTLGEYNADYTQLLVQLEENRLLCLEGIEQEKVSVKDGVLVVTERYPQVAQAAIMGKLAVLKELARISELAQIDPEISININLEALEDAHTDTNPTPQGAEGDP